MVNNGIGYVPIPKTRHGMAQSAGMVKLHVEQFSRHQRFRHYLNSASHHNRPIRRYQFGCSLRLTRLPLGVKANCNIVNSCQLAPFQCSNTVASRVTDDCDKTLSPAGISFTLASTPPNFILVNGTGWRMLYTWLR